MTKLYRSNTDKVFAGVCGGLAEYFHVDVTIIRLLWLAFILIGGIGFWLYILAAVIIPKAPYDGNVVYDSTSQYYDSGHAGLIIGIFLILIGALLILNRFFSFNFIRILFNFGWPALLIIVGIVIIISSFRKR